MRAGFPIATPGLCVGLFGGSFDPAHEGHVHVSREAMRRFGLDRVWWLVSPGNPLKQRQPAPLDQRIGAARALLTDPRIEVTGLEAELGTRLTVETIAALQALYPDTRFAWLMGADNMVQFHLWDRWQEIAARVPIGVLARPGWRLKARVSVAAQILARHRLRGAQVRRLCQAVPPAWAVIDIPMHPASSTALRQGGAGDAEDKAGKGMGETGNDAGRDAPRHAVTD